MANLASSLKSNAFRGSFCLETSYSPGYDWPATEEIRNWLRNSGYTLDGESCEYWRCTINWGERTAQVSMGASHELLPKADQIREIAVRT